MLLVAALTLLVVLATTVAADLNATPKSPISLSVTKQINRNGVIHPSQYQKRWINLVKGARRPTSEVTDVPLTDSVATTGYLANIGVGDPPIFCGPSQFLPGIVSCMPILDSLVVDTGSSNTWLGANKPYKKTKTGMKTSNFFVSALSFHADTWLSTN